MENQNLKTHKFIIKRQIKRVMKTVSKSVEIR